MRVVSLVPSVTETMLAWGVTPVAVTRFCERRDLVQVGGTKDPDIEAIVALAPDLVVMNDDENRLADADALEHAGVRVHVVRIDAVDDVGPELDALADAVGVPRRATSLAPPRTPWLRAFVPIWRRPWMTMSGGCYGSSLLGRIGVVNVFADASARYPETTLDEAAARSPDVVLAPSEPYPFTDRHRDELDLVAPVVLVDGQDLFWWGARTAAALDRLSDVVDAIR